jgi:hypothetical protein
LKLCEVEAGSQILYCYWLQRESEISKQIKEWHGSDHQNDDDGCLILSKLLGKLQPSGSYKSASLALGAVYVSTFKTSCFGYIQYLGLMPFLIYLWYPMLSPKLLHHRRLATCPFQMATTNPPQTQAHFPEIDDDGFSDDTESIASNESDDGEEHPPEKIIAELHSRNGTWWYLVKWQNCPVLRSSWEFQITPETCPQLFADWEVEKQKQARGESKPLDLIAFTTAVVQVEEAERHRRTLRRLKRKVRRVLSIVDT